MMSLFRVIRLGRAVRAMASFEMLTEHCILLGVELLLPM